MYLVKSADHTGEEGLRVGNLTSIDLLEKSWHTSSLSIYLL